MDPTKEAFVVHLAYLESKMSIYRAWAAQIVLLVAEKVTVSKKYSDFANVFSKRSVAKLPKRSDIIKYTIDLGLGKQPPYGLIYSLEPIELETLKIYIETNLANDFI